jgi:hypothetical protein
MANNELGKFFQCELKFVFWLAMGLLILNSMGLLFQYIFNVALLVSIVVSIIVLLLYCILFLYQLIRIIGFGQDYICTDIKQRVSGWLSSLV